MSRTLFLQPVEIPLPYFATHAEWCSWLRGRGQLSPQHRGCLGADHCVADKNHGRVEERWRGSVHDREKGEGDEDQPAEAVAQGHLVPRLGLDL